MRACKGCAPGGVAVQNDVDFGTRAKNSGVDFPFACGFPGARPFKRFDIDDGKVVGRHNDVIESRRGDKRVLFVKADRDIAPGALHEVFFQHSDACVFDHLS